AEDGIRDFHVTGVQTCALPISGEIVVRGPMVFQGYWGRESDNAETFRGGWHHTGDLGRYDDDGYLWYQGRSPAKELIKPGGENRSEERRVGKGGRSRRGPSQRK